MANEQTQLPQIVQSLDQVPGVRQGLMLLALAGSVALGVTVVLWMQREPMTALPVMEDMSAAHDLLMAEGISVDDAGTRLRVPMKDADRARRLVEENGYISASGRNCEREAGAGGMVTTTAKEAFLLNCRREVSLGRTIASLQPVRHASVHLSRSKERVFLNEDGEVKASITVSLMPSGSIDRRNLALSIVSIVAGSVPNLSRDNVTVIDSKGIPLSDVMGTDGDIVATSTRQDKARRAREQQYEAQIRKILSRTLGPGHYEVSVAADIDFTSTERTVVSPTEGVPIGNTEQITEQKNGSVGITPPGGVPGGTSNTPVPQGDPADTGNADNGGGSDPANRSTSRTTNYETGEVIEVQNRPSGSIRRLTVAVLLDALTPRPETAGGMTNGEDAAAAQGGDDDDTAAADANSQPRFNELDIAKFKMLIQDAIAFDEQRGDRISVESLPFQQIMIDEVPSTPMWREPWVMDLARQGAGALFVVVLFFTTIRPMISRLLASAPMTLQAAGAGAYGNATLSGPEGTDTGESKGNSSETNRAGRIEDARDFASKNPDMTVQVMREWVNQD